MTFTCMRVRERVLVVRSSTVPPYTINNSTEYGIIACAGSSCAIGRDAGLRVQLFRGDGKYWPVGGGSGAGADFVSYTKNRQPHPASRIPPSSTIAIMCILRSVR